jgi:hypothetical protein
MGRGRRQEDNGAKKGGRIKREKKRNMMGGKKEKRIKIEKKNYGWTSSYVNISSCFSVFSNQTYTDDSVSPNQTITWL